MSESIKKIYLEAVKLDPSAIITLFEIDASNITGDVASSIFRFHNNFKIFQTSIFFGEKEFFALPIQVEGFEVSTKGASPTPKLSLASSIEGLSTGSFLSLKNIVRDTGDLAGVKVTRYKTFVRYIDRKNFYDSSNVLLSADYPAPEGFDPDRNAVFPPDIYFIDRKSMETKDFLEFELGSLFDLQGIKLPGRIVLQKNCTWRYRGEGCGYEQFSRRGGTVLKDEASSSFPSYAPSVANDKDEKIVEYLTSKNQTLSPSVSLWISTVSYSPGSVVYKTIKNINYYFVSKIASTNQNPPNDTYWIQDQCSKSLAGCKLRWGAGSPLAMSQARDVVALGGDFPWKNPQNGHLPFGGFPGVARL